MYTIRCHYDLTLGHRDKCLREVPLHLLRLVALDGEGATKLLVTRGVILHPALVSVHLLLHQVIVSFTSEINSSFIKIIISTSMKFCDLFWRVG